MDSCKNLSCVHCGSFRIFSVHDHPMIKKYQCHLCCNISYTCIHPDCLSLPSQRHSFKLHHQMCLHFRNVHTNESYDTLMYANALSKPHAAYGRVTPSSNGTSIFHPLTGPKPAHNACETSELNCSRDFPVSNMDLSSPLVFNLSALNKSDRQSDSSSESDDTSPVGTLLSGHSASDSESD